MIVAAISDTHRYEELVRVPPCDLFVHAGDFGFYGNQKEMMRAGSWFRDLEGPRHKIFVPGNHEAELYERWPRSKSEWLLSKCPDLKILTNDRIEIEGKQIHGFSYTPSYDFRFNGWTRDEGEPMERQCMNIDEGLDLLICHGPPIGFLDRNHQHKNCGSRALQERILKVKPRIVIFGHIHYQGGMKDQYKDITFYNVAGCSEYTERNPSQHLVNQPTVFEI